MSTVVPFPFRALEAISRGDVASGAALRRFARAHVRLEAVSAALAELLDESVSILVRRTRRMDAARGADDSIGVMLAPADDARAQVRRALVEIDGALAARIASRALKQRAPRVTDASRVASPALAGAAAAVIAAVLRRAHAGAALRVVAAGPGHVLARDLQAATADATTAWLTVVVGADAYEARVSVPDAAALAVPDSDVRDGLLALGEAPIALPLVVCSSLATRTDLATLARGDAFVPPRGAIGSLSSPSNAGGALVGKVALIAPRGERGLGADLAEGGRLVVRGLETHSWEFPMPNDSTPTAVVLEDAPVVVRVELGAVELPARDWANLAPGDVLTLGRKLGDAAILRVGGVEVARGELVSVDGEYGVRILSRSGG